MTIRPPDSGRSGLGDQAPAVSDAVLDAGSTSDVAYLERLGYKQELHRALGLFSSFGVQFSSISVGSGMLTTLIVGLAFFGPASIWAFTIGGGFQVLAVGLAVAELVSAYPLCGGVYPINNRITRKAWLGWQTGWWLVIAHTVSVTAVAVSMAPFVANWFGVTLSSSIATVPWVLGLIVLVTVINLLGVKVSAFMNNLGVIAEIAGVLIVVVALLALHHPTQPISILANTGGTVAHGQWLKPFLFAFILPAYMISSFDSSGNASEETHDAARQAPKGLFIANTSAWLFGIFFIALILLAIQNLPQVMQSAVPVKLILDNSIGAGITQVFQAIAIVALTACLAMLQLTGARVIWSQARDGQMPGASWLRKVNRRRIPVTATVVVCVASILFALWSSLLAVLAALTALAWALAYGVVVTTGFWALLKKRLPAHPWGYGRFSPIIFGVAILWSVVICAVLVWSDPKQVGLGMLVTIAVGFVLYALIPRARRGKVVGVTPHDQAGAPID